MLALLLSLGLDNAYREYASHATNLRSALLNSYDKMIPPVSNRTDVYESADGGKTSLAGTEVGVNLRVFKVESVDTASSHLKLKVWFRMQWSDLRLAWDPAEFGGITQTQMRAAAITIDQDSDIWLPDIQPYNAGEAVASTLEPSLALVYSDGTVYWSRPGILDILCKFRGLNAFPFHRELRCPIDVGGWMLSGTFQGISLLDGGSTVYDAVANEDSSGSSYAEWHVGNISAELRSLTYPCCPNEPWPVIAYDVRLTREQTFFYNYYLLMPSILFSVLALLSAFLPPDSGERLGFGVTLVLAREFCKALVQQLTPICDEQLWIQNFDVVNEIFTTLPVVVTLVVMFFHYREVDFASKMVKILKARFITSLKKEEQVIDYRESVSARLHRAYKAVERRSGGDAMTGGDRYTQFEAALPRTSTSDGVTLAPPPAPPSPPGAAPIHPAPTAGTAAGVSFAAAAPSDRASAAPERTSAARLIFYERLFFKLDLAVDQEGQQLFVEFEDVDRFLSFVCFEMTAAERTRLIVDSQSERLQRMEARELYEEQVLNITRSEFVKICQVALRDKNDDDIIAAAASFVAANDLHTKAVVQRMRGISVMIDTYFRRIGLPCYFIGIVGLFIVSEPIDNAEENNGEPMMRINTAGLAGTVAVLLLCMLWWAGHMFVQFKLVAGEEEAKAKHIVSLLAVQKHGPGLTSLLENLRRNRHPSLGRRASAVVAAASPLKMSRAGL